MSSKAAYFPEALGRAAEVPETPCGVPEIALQLPVDASEKPVQAPTQNFEASDERLLEQVCDGCKEALGLLFRRHARSIRNVAYRILRDEAEADDLVQEVFLFIFRKAALYDPGKGRAVTWIIHLAYHRAFDRRRHLISRHFYASQDLRDASLHLADKREGLRFHEQSMEG